jgi:hypothetical protein
MFGIPVALEAFKASKEVLVRRPAPPGIWPFSWQTNMMLWIAAADIAELETSNISPQTKESCHSSLSLTHSIQTFRAS